MFAVILGYDQRMRPEETCTSLKLSSELKETPKFAHLREKTAPGAAGPQKWYRGGKLHRDGSAAMERADGTKIWYDNGQRHRDDGPAVEHLDGRKEWWLRGRRVGEAKVRAAQAAARTKRLEKIRLRTPEKITF